MESSSICSVTTIKATLAYTLCFVSYHLNHGLDHLYLYFDNPLDPAIARLKDHPKVTCMDGSVRRWEEKMPDCIITHNQRQSFNATEALGLAREAGYAWLLHFDSDELLYTSHPIKSMLAKVPKKIKVLCFHNIEGVPQTMHTENFFTSTHYFKSQPPKQLKTKGISKFTRLSFSDRKKMERQQSNFLLKKKEAEQRGCVNAFNGKFYNGYEKGKCATRTTAPIEEINVHYPVPLKNKRLRINYPDWAQLLHFDCCSYSHWYNRWANAMKKQRFDWPKGQKRRNHLEEFIPLFEAKDETGLKALYQRRYILPVKEIEILTELGLIQTIHLPEELFVFPNVVGTKI